MHICFISNEYPKEGFPHGGVGTFLKTIAPSLIALGHKVSVVGVNYTNSEEESIENNISIYRVKKHTQKGLAWFLNARAINSKINEIHLASPIDIIESAELGLAFINKTKGIKYVIRLHGGHHFFAEAENRGINKWKGFQEKKSFKKADAFIAVSNYVKSHTEKYLSYNNKPLGIIFNPINNQFFDNYNEETESYNITFTGTICEKKGVRQLIQAFSIVKEKFPKAKLHLFGRDWLFPNGESYIKMLQKIELPKIIPYDSDVLFYGAINYNKIPIVFAKSQVCVFPSHMETLGLVAPEAMAMGKPVIFTEKGPGSEIINHSISGLLCNPHDPIDIADKISWVFDNFDKANEMGENARKDVLQLFQVDALVNKNIEFYKKIR